MKNFTFIVFSFFMFFAAFHEMHAQNLRQFNGWEFLKWNSDTTEVSKVLQEKGIEFFTRNYLKGPLTEFDYDEMHTTLVYDSLGHFSSVVQHNDFGISRLEESKTFFEKTKKQFLQKYGKPASNKHDMKKEIITMTWNLKFTRIILTYDYRYKIVDELGCCSYTVRINFNPI